MSKELVLRASDTVEIDQSLEAQLQVEVSCFVRIYPLDFVKMLIFDTLLCDTTCRVTRAGCMRYLQMLRR